MNDIKFAKLHEGETFNYRGEAVKVVGYDSVGCGAAVIVEGFSVGWSSDALSLGDVILCPPAEGEEVKYWYVSEYDLDSDAEENPMRILIIGKPGTGKPQMAKRVSKDYRLPIVDEVPTLDHIPNEKGIYVSNSIDPVEAAKRKDEFKLIIIM
nr:MAG TPA: putative adenylyl-sulfate kinase [Caudoviricetes sp.]